MNLYQLHIHKNSLSPPTNRITITEAESPKPTKPQIHDQPQPQQAYVQPKPMENKIARAPKRNKDKIPSALQLKDSGSLKFKDNKPATPTGLKRFWPPSPKLRANTMSSSLWTLAVHNSPLDKENERSRSTISLHSPSSSPTTLLYKKPKWYKKLLSPNIGSSSKLSVESDNTDLYSIEKSRKKKKWYRKRFISKTRPREAIAYEI